MEFKLLTKNEYIKSLSLLEELFNNSFKRNIDRNILAWRYTKNPINELLVYVAIENNKIISNYSVSPCEVDIDGKIYKIALSMTTMTDPKYCGQGLFPKLANFVYDEMRKLGYIAIIGFPNNNSHRTFINKLGWKDIYEIPTLKLDLNLIKSLDTSNRLDIVSDNEFNYNYSLVNSSKVKIYKDKSYLNWRFTNHPTNKYFNYAILKEDIVTTYVVIKKYLDNAIDIVDYSTIDSNQLYTVLSYLLIKLKNSGIKEVNTWAQPHNPSYYVFEKIGFTNEAPIVYFAGKSFTTEANILMDYKNWSITMGDSDVY